LSTTAVTKVTSSALSKLKPHLIRWFLKKYYPFDTRKLVIEFTDYPNAILNFETQEHELWFGFKLSNFSLYELEIINIDCQIRVEGHDVARIKAHVAHALKSDGEYQFRSHDPLAPGEASRIKRYALYKTNQATFIFHLTVRSRFGIQEIWMPDKTFCLDVRQYPSPGQ
jgi:hypothetical protein